MFWNKTVGRHFSIGFAILFLRSSIPFSKNNLTHWQSMRCSQGSVLRFSRCLLLKYFLYNLSNDFLQRTMISKERIAIVSYFIFQYNHIDHIDMGSSLSVIMVALLSVGSFTNMATPSRFVNLYTKSLMSPTKIVGLIL